MNINKINKIGGLLYLFFILSITNGFAQTGSTAPTNNLAWKAGETYTLEFNSVRGDGYKWELVNYADSSVVRYMGLKFVPDPDTTFHGKVGKDIFTFKAEKRGEALLTFAYRRSWERAIPRVERYQVIVEK